MMLFTKPKGVRYVDMAIYIDNIAYSENLTELEEIKIYEYLYLLCNMLARKNKYFKKEKYYEDFAILAANRAFFRLKNPKQFILDQNGEPKMTKIKSILNYIKSILYPCKVEFEQENYAQVLSKPEESEKSYTINEILIRNNDRLSIVEFDVCLGDIINTTKKFLENIPYKTSKAEWNNIYVSCLLTFLNSITISSKNQARILIRDNVEFYKDKTLNNIYKEEDENSTTLFHLDPIMKDYIKILVNKLKHVIAKDLSMSLNTHIDSAGDLNSLFLTPKQGE
jgi:hypothetical protein